MTILPMDRIEAIVEAALKGYRGRNDWPDIKQEALLAAWQAIDTGKGSAAEPSTVAWNAARWAAGDYLRRQRPVGFKRRGGEPEGCSLEAIPEPAARTADRSAWDWGWVADVPLPPRYRKIFELHYRDGVKQASIATAEGVTPSRIQQVIEECRCRIRESLGLVKQPTTHCQECGKFLVQPNPRRRYCNITCKQRTADRRRRPR